MAFLIVLCLLRVSPLSAIRTDSPIQTRSERLRDQGECPVRVFCWLTNTTPRSSVCGLIAESQTEGGFSASVIWRGTGIVATTRVESWRVVRATMSYRVLCLDEQSITEHIYLRMLRG